MTSERVSDERTVDELIDRLSAGFSIDMAVNGLKATQADLDMKEASRLLRSAREAEPVLPCDVSLPPSTVIRKGCQLSTLHSALQARGMVHASPSAEQMDMDAARYRFLRGRDLEIIRKGGVFAGLTPDNVVLNGEDLDNAIDLTLSSRTGREG